jgi:hypothetical protein
MMMKILAWGQTPWFDDREVDLFTVPLTLFAGSSLCYSWLKCMKL